MEDKTLLLEELIAEGKKKGYINLNKILELLDEESEQFDEFIKRVEAEGIDLVKDELEENGEFEVEVELEDDLDPFAEMESDPDLANSLVKLRTI